MTAAELLGCLGLPDSEAWISKYIPRIVLEPGPAVEISDPDLTFYLDCKYCIGVIVNTWTLFAQRRYTLFIKNGATDDAALYFPLGGGVVSLKITGHFEAGLLFELIKPPGPPPSFDISINTVLVKIPPLPTDHPTAD